MSMEKYVDKIGVGVEISDVIVFQTRLMMGVQFERLIAAKVKQGDEKKREVLIACLRLGWNDAFRHTSKNVMDGTKSVLEKESAKYNKEHKQEYDDYICGKILEDEKFYDIFMEYALKASTWEKRDVVKQNWDVIVRLFQVIKEVDGDKALCFGHFQKMFNMALKLYLCLYICKEALGLDDYFFDENILSNLRNADCPIDGIILKRLDQKLGKKEEYSKIKWSKMDADESRYVEIQKAIDETNYISRLSFDFKEWNKICSE